MSKKWTGERLETFIENNYMIEHLHRYALTQDYIKDKVVLDIASGEGYGSNLIARYARHVVGVDISEEAIANAKQKYKKENLKFEQGSAAEIPLPSDFFDVVISFETLEHHNKHEEMFSEIKRVLKPGGIMILSSPDKLNYSDRRGYNNVFHVKELYEKEFRELVGRYFNFASYYLQKSIFSSVIIPEKKQGSFIEYSGNYGEVNMVPEFNQHYLIAIASDVELPQLNISIFKDDNYNTRLFNEQRDMLFKSKSYQLGNLFLFPFKYLYKLFKS